MSVPMPRITGALVHELAHPPMAASNPTNRLAHQEMSDVQFLHLDGATGPTVS